MTIREESKKKWPNLGCSQEGEEVLVSCEPLGAEVQLKRLRLRARGSLQEQ